MDTARLFQSGRSQAVRLPKAYRFNGTEVIVKHFGNGVLLLPIEDPWQTLEAGLAAFEPLPAVERRTPLFFAVRRFCFLGRIALPDGAANLLEPRLDYFATALGLENRRRSLACTQQRRDVDVIKVL